MAFRFRVETGGCSADKAVSLRVAWRDYVTEARQKSAARRAGPRAKTERNMRGRSEQPELRWRKDKSPP